jgi:hypothetical protein
MAYQVGELVVEPLAEGHHVLDVGESRGLHLLDQVRDEVARFSSPIWSAATRFSAISSSGIGGTISKYDQFVWI